MWKKTDFHFPTIWDQKCTISSLRYKRGYKKTPFAMKAFTRFLYSPAKKSFTYIKMLQKLGIKFHTRGHVSRQLLQRLCFLIALEIQWLKKVIIVILQKSIATLLQLCAHFLTLRKSIFTPAYTHSARTVLEKRFFFVCTIFSLACWVRWFGHKGSTVSVAWIAKWLGVLLMEC